MAGFQAQVRGVFCEAIGSKTPEEQSEYLDRACQGQPELRARVDALCAPNRRSAPFCMTLPPRRPTHCSRWGPAR